MHSLPSYRTAPRAPGLAAAIGLALLAMSAPAVRAQTSIPIVNSSFEVPVLSDGTWQGEKTTDWSGSFIYGIENMPGDGTSQWAGGVPFGNQSGYLGNGLSTGTSRMCQRLTELLLPNQTYELSAYMGWRSGDPLTPVARMELWAGGTVVNGDVVGGTLLASITPPMVKGQFPLRKLSFTTSGATTGLGLPITIRFQQTAKAQLTIDGVQLTRTTNTPGSIAATPTLFVDNFDGDALDKTFWSFKYFSPTGLIDSEESARYRVSLGGLIIDMDHFYQVFPYYLENVPTVQVVRPTDTSWWGVSVGVQAHFTGTGTYQSANAGVLFYQDAQNYVRLLVGHYQDPGINFDVPTVEVVSGGVSSTIFTDYSAATPNVLGNYWNLQVSQNAPGTSISFGYNMNATRFKVFGTVSASDTGANKALFQILNNIGNLRVGVGHDNAYSTSFTSQMRISQFTLYNLGAAPQITAPTTTASYSPGFVPNGWNRGAVNVTLTPTSGEPISSLNYTLDGVAQTAPNPTAPTTINVSGEGQHTLTYGSVGQQGRTEATHTVKFGIDSTPPTYNDAGVTFIGGSSTYNWVSTPTLPVTVKGILSDSLSGIDPASVKYEVSDAKDNITAYSSSGSVVLNSDGSFQFSLDLPAQPILVYTADNVLQDALPRVYKIVVSAKDLAGNDLPQSVYGPPPVVIRKLILRSRTAVVMGVRG